jgi:hypothetical protein
MRWSTSSVPFKLLYFRGSRLRRHEVIDAEDALEAIHIAAARPSNDVTELWQGDRKLATFRPVRHQH